MLAAQFAEFDIVNSCGRRWKIRYGQFFTAAELEQVTT